MVFFSRHRAKISITVRTGSFVFQVFKTKLHCFFSLNGDICLEHREQIPESLRERLVNSPFQCPFGGLGEMLQIVGEFHKTIFFFH